MSSCIEQRKDICENIHYSCNEYYSIMNNNYDAEVREGY